MRIVYILPGVGDTFYCQNCIKNMDLINELKKKGHDVLFVPMYLPSIEEESLKIRPPVFFGAISVYLREKLPFLRKLPLFLTSWMDARWLLKLISKRTGATNPVGLEEMTLSVLKGEEGIMGKAGKPVAKLIPYDLETSPRKLGVGHWQGQIWIADDFDDLPEDIMQLFSGEENEDESIA